MSDSTKTYAVVVGVEKYAAGSAWDLDGPASDACRFVQWLRRRGVPVNQISLFLSALDGNNGLTNQLDVAALAATQDVVKTALTETLTKKRGDLLYFFWGGHGVVDAQGNRRLFYADATENNLRHLNLNNLLAAWRTAVLSGFPQQIGFIDACANYIEHMRRAVSMPEETYPASVPVAGVEQFVLLAAAPGELARNQTAKKSGAFSEALLAQLEQSSNGWPPDLQQITQRLQEHFAALRDAGEARQTPAHFWFRDWNGSEGTLGSLVRQPQPTAGGGEELGFVQRGKLTNALLACEVMSNTQTRESVISDLRREIKFNTWRNPASSIDVGNLVRTAMHYSGGLAELLTVVRFYEQGSLAAQELDRVVAMLLPGIGSGN